MELTQNEGGDRRPDRNLKRDEKKLVILAFIDILKNINLNSKPLIAAATSRAITMNPKVTVEEIQKTLGVTDSSKLDFIRQLYIRSGNSILKQLFPDENILNIPTVSFSQQGESISLNY